MSRWAFRFCSHAWIGLFPSQEGCSLPVRETESEVPTFLTLCFSLLTLFWRVDTPGACGHGERRDLFVPVGRVFVVFLVLVLLVGVVASIVVVCSTA